MRASLVSLKYAVEARTSSERNLWDTIAGFDCEKPARDYVNACGASGGADLYRLLVRTGWNWTVIATTGKAAAALDAATARNHPAVAATRSSPSQVSA